MSVGGSRGAFILFEGLDRSGKSTQARMLVDALTLSGRPSTLLRFPDRSTPIGKLIDEYLTKQHTEAPLPTQAMHLLFAANRWELAQTLRKHIAQGTHIVVDRYALSGIAYTAAQGVDTQWANKPDQLLPAPDVVFFMDINPEDAKKRGDYGKELYEREDMQRRVREQFGKLKHAVHFEWRDIEAGRDMDTIHKELLQSTLEIIERVQHTELSDLKFNPEEENKVSHL